MRQLLAIGLLCAAGAATTSGDAEPSISSSSHAAAHGKMGRLLDGYDDAMYKTMRDDAPRTAAYAAAIEKLAPGKVVLDIGTGQFALLAIIAARAGARYVYAIEGNRQAFERAKLAVSEQNFTDRIGVLHGYSANVSLQELPPPSAARGHAEADVDDPSRWAGVDLVVHELLGEIAGMEGAAFAIADAHRRHIRAAAPAVAGAAAADADAAAAAPRVSVPYGARSFIAPAVFPPPEYWSKLAVPVIMTPGTTFLKLWEFPEGSLLSESDSSSF
jgi:SAM-dependent methyltransferase